jgi:hypothetical protein
MGRFAALCEPASLEEKKIKDLNLNSKTNFILSKYY